VQQQLARMGSDGITAEHFLYSHPLLTVLLSNLFRMMPLQKCVPFGVGMIVPHIGDVLDTTNADNYQAMSFEICLAHGMES